MKAATRLRWLELVKRRLAARRGRQLLEEKREALLRAVARARGERDAARGRAATALEKARALFAQAQVELAPETIEAAALAQTSAPTVAFERRSRLGVTTSCLRATLPPLRLRWAPGGTCESLDRAAAAFADALPLVVGLADQELVLEGLREGLVRTSRRCNALEQILLPELEEEIARIEGALEEEARDEAIRTRRRARRGLALTGAPAAGRELLTDRS